MDAIGLDALKPNPRLEAFSPFIGTWRIAGGHPLLPGEALEGRTSFAWHEGGAFVIMHSEMQHPKIPPAVAIFGSDDQGGITMLYFDRRGVSRHYEVRFDGDRMCWHRDDPKLAQTMILVPGSERREISQTGRMSVNGGPWQEDLSLTYRPA